MAILKHQLFFDGWWILGVSFLCVRGYIGLYRVCVSGSYHTGEMLRDVQTSLAHWRNYFPSVKWRIHPISKTSFLQPQNVPETRHVLIPIINSSSQRGTYKTLSVLHISLIIHVNGSMTKNAFYNISPFSDGLRTVTLATELITQAIHYGTKLWRAH